MENITWDILLSNKNANDSFSAFSELYDIIPESLNKHAPEKEVLIKK